ncbi:MAG: hypothetical protein FJX76_01415 [Armatimonadetes bacterium]|nr:hypothetical protein [Armatimonadota bacterium]
MTNDDLIDAAELGEQAKRFLDSDVGLSILREIEHDEAEAVARLADTDPTKTGEIMKWQVELKAAQKLRAKLRLLVTIGENAKQAWKAQHDS